MLKDKLQADLKEAMLSRDTARIDVLKGLKSSILYAEVEQGKRDNGLTNEEVFEVFKKEAKKRQDSIDMYTQGGDSSRAEKEKAEKDIIDSYLPAQLSEDDIGLLVDAALQELGIEQPQKQDLGRIIGLVKQKAGAQADGATIAKSVTARVT